MKTLLKLGKVLSTIAFIASIIVVVFCCISVVSVKAGGTGEIAQIGNTTISGILSDIGISEEPYLLDMLIIMIVFGIASFISGFAAMRFFTKEMKASMLFNSECGNRCRTTGVWIAAVNLLAAVICGIIYTIRNVVFEDYASMNTSAGISFGIGIGFIICSAIIEAAYREINHLNAGGIQKR